jgi:hypothetical protein
MFFKTYNNLIDQESLTRLNETLFDKFFPWYFFDKSVNSVNNTENLFYSTSALRHCFAINGKIESTWFYLIEPILTSIANKFQSDVEIINAHANLMMASISATEKLDVPHIDLDNSPGDCYTSIFYLHDSKEATIIYNENTDSNSTIDVSKLNIKTKVIPEKNKLSIWRTTRIHSGPGSVTNHRIVINLNFRILNQKIVNENDYENI